MLLRAACRREGGGGRRRSDADGAGGAASALDASWWLAPSSLAATAPYTDSLFDEAKPRRASDSMSFDGCSVSSASSDASGLKDDSSGDSDQDAREALKLLTFPDDFVFGVATAAYQIEGAAKEGQRSPSIWDEFSKKLIATGDVACDHYHLFREDVAIMARLGIKAYRFSISWSRLIPTGEGNVSPIGEKFYSDLIDELLMRDIEPWVTLYHWDMPAVLEKKFGGWLGRKRDVMRAFGHFARSCFTRFGNRVKRWMTINEPYCVAIMGYAHGVHPPGRGLHAGIEPSTEPYAAGHNLLLAHSEAVRIYKQEGFAERQGGIIGIVLNMDYRRAFDSKHEADRDAAQRYMDFYFGWFADPVFFGCYPESMRKRCGARLPYFTQDEAKLLKGSSDFLGLNLYSGSFVAAPGTRQIDQPCWFTDIGARTKADPAWEKTDCKWPVTPWALREGLLYVHKRYSPPCGVYVTENGCAFEGQASADVDRREPGALVPRPRLGPCAAMNFQDDSKLTDDPERVRFLRAHVIAIHEALGREVDVRGCFVWSLLDNFEWVEGYGKRFGIVRVDYPTQRRSIKKSGHVYADIIKRRALSPLRPEEEFRTSFRRTSFTYSSRNDLSASDGASAND